ncbi:MAG: nidogen-like domain-containing protein, partial [Promethearchaeota archaeon]
MIEKHRLKACLFLICSGLLFISISGLINHSGPEHGSDIAIIYDGSQNTMMSSSLYPMPLKNYSMIVDYPFNWIDASSGTELIINDDDSRAQAIPFDFMFYNETFRTVYISSNGYLSFSDTTPTHYSNINLPTDNVDFRFMIAPFWDDLLTENAGGNGTVYVYTDNSTFLVVEWFNINRIDDYLVGTFEVVLKNSSEIIFNYDSISYTDGVYTCGLNYGLNLSYYNSYAGL